MCVYTHEYASVIHCDMTESRFFVLIDPNVYKQKVPIYISDVGVHRVVIRVRVKSKKGAHTI